jgi:hypothetical protein
MVASSGDDAGKLTIAGGSIPASAMVSDFAGIYSSSAAGTAMSAGQTVTVAATGGMVPAFGPEAVTAPSMITLLAPLGADGGPPGIARNADLAVSWSSGQSGAQVVLTLGVDADPLSSIACTWDAPLGQGTVPQALLSRLTQGAGSLTYGAQTSRTFAAGPYTITESAAVTSGAAVSFR